MEFAIGGAGEAGDFARPLVAHVEIELFGGVALAGVEDEEGAAEGGSLDFDGLHEGAADTAAAGAAVDEEFADFGAVAGVGLVGEQELDGAEDAVEVAGDEEDELAFAKVVIDGVPVFVGFVTGEGGKETNAGAAFDGILKKFDEVFAQRLELVRMDNTDLHGHFYGSREAGRMGRGIHLRGRGGKSWERAGHSRGT